MGIFDIIVSVMVLIALVNGWRKGLIAQLCSLIAIIGGVWLASEFGAKVGSLFGIEPQYAKAAGFLVIFVAVLILLMIVSRIVKKLFSFIGLGILDSIFGAMLSVAKVALVMGLLCSAFDSLNEGLGFVEKSTLDNTIFFRPLCRSTEVLDLFDADQVEKVIEEQVKKTVDSIDV